MVVGIQLFVKEGIPTSKLVLGVPWYGYVYSCATLLVSFYRATIATCFSDESGELTTIIHASFSSKVKIMLKSIIRYFSALIWHRLPK